MLRMPPCCGCLQNWQGWFDECAQQSTMAHLARQRAGANPWAVRRESVRCSRGKGERNVTEWRSGWLPSGHGRVLRQVNIDHKCGPPTPTGTSERMQQSCPVEQGTRGVSARVDGCSLGGPGGGGGVWETSPRAEADHISVRSSRCAPDPRRTRNRISSVSSVRTQPSC